ncbi:MAG TPA: hypothetical protein VGR98_14460 [Streptosporangiaceae bacterium]|nr:hypothetical protein [Streptosporangiaceae bacterium]
MHAARRLRSITVIAALGASSLAVLAAPGGGGTAPPAAASAAAAARKVAFPHPTRVNNRLFPLVPGTQFIYQGRIVQGGKSTPHSVVFTVTGLTKMVGGVRTVVAWDRDFLDGRLEEQEIALFAQDSRGNVWNFGEYPEEYDNGKFTGAPSTWVKGVRGDMGGIHVLARPTVGAQYVEGRVPSIGFFDVSRVIGTGQTACVRSRCFRHVVVVDEWSPNDPQGGHQIKYYARHTGLVRVGARGGDQQEFLQLTSVRHLAPAALARVQAQVLAIDRRAYQIARVWRATGHAVCCQRDDDG